MARSTKLRSRLLIQPLEDRRVPATITVNTLADNTSVDGKCSLREAITSANNNANANNDVALFKSGTYGLGQNTADVIVFDPAVFTTPQQIKLLSALPDITEQVDITGTSAVNITITRASGAPNFRLLNFTVPSVQTSHVSNLTLSGGSASAGGAVQTSGVNAIYFTDCVFTNNSATTSGGAIYVSGTGSFNLVDCTLANNSAPRGGAIELNNFIGVHLETSAFLNNKATSQGGGAIDFSSGNSGSSIYLSNSTMSGNSAAGSGGAVFCSSATVTLDISNCTIMNNTANAQGGGISLVDNNAASIENSIVAGNSNADSPDIAVGLDYGTAKVNWSAIGNTSGFTLAGANNLPIGADLKLGQLANNGGPTQTFMPAFDSPLVDQGVNNYYATTDQRGMTRLVGNGTDIGAVEVVQTTVASINRVTAAFTKASVVSWNIIFDTLYMTGLTTANFQLTGPGAAGASISNITGGGPFWTVTANTGADGLLGLNLVNSNNLFSLPTNLPFTGQSYTVDKTAPQVVSIIRSNPETNDLGGVLWQVLFNENVSGVSLSDFKLSSTGLGGNPNLTTFFGLGGAYLIGASTGTGSGTLTLSLNSNSGIIDSVGHVVTNAPFTGQTYTIDRTNPTVAITCSTPTINDFKTGPNGLTLFATFDKPMDQTVAPSFSFPVENPAPSINLASGSWLNSTTYQATFNVFDFNATVPNIDVSVTGGKDLIGHAHTQTTKADLFNIDTFNPLVLAIGRSEDLVATNEPTVSWDIVFSEPVSGLSASNFLLFNGGLGGSPAITFVGGNGQYWQVNASTGTGQGNLSLYMTNPVGVSDAAGNYVAALPVQGPHYAIDHVAPQAAKLTANTVVINDANVGPNAFQVTVSFSEPMNQAVQPAFSFPVENPSPSLAFAAGQWLDAKTYRATFNAIDLGVEIPNIDIKVAGAEDVVGNVQVAIVAAGLLDIDTKSPTIAKVQIDDGSGQRSMVRSLRVEFTEAVQLPANPADAFELIGLNGRVDVSVDLGLSSPGQTIATLTFSGANTEFGSLKDGRYSFRVLANQTFDSVGNTFDGDANGTSGDDFVLPSSGANGVFRLFGDLNGDAKIDAIDFGVFRNAFNTGLGNSLFKSACDYNNDGKIDAVDFGAFRMRFNTVV